MANHMDTPWNPADGSINGKWLRWGAFNSQSVYFELGRGGGDITQTVRQDLNQRLRNSSLKRVLWFIFYLAGCSFMWHLFKGRTKQCLDVWMTLREQRTSKKILRNLGKEKSDVTNNREMWVSIQLSARKQTKTHSVVLSNKTHGVLQTQGEGDSPS